MVQWSKIMSVDRIVEELKQERARLERAIAALAEPSSPKGVVRKVRGTTQQPAATQQPVASPTTKRGGMTPEGRKRLSLAMKKRWAERRKKSS
jgi:hypothetical protein